MDDQQRRVELYLDDTDASQEQKDVVAKVQQRFPNLAVAEYRLDSLEALDRGIILAPGMVIDGVIIGVGRVVSAGRIRRFIEQQQEGESNG